MTQVGMNDDPHLFELFEVPIDRRQIDVGSLRLDHLSQLFGGPMAGRIEEGMEEEPSGTSDPPSSLPDQGQHIVDGVDADQ